MVLYCTALHCGLGDVIESRAGIAMFCMALAGVWVRRLIIRYFVFFLTGALWVGVL